MSKQARTTQFWQLYDAFLGQNPRELLTAPQAYSDFDGLNLEEARSTITFVLGVLDSLRPENRISELSWQFFNQLQANYKTFTTYTASSSPHGTNNRTRTSCKTSITLPTNSGCPGPQL